MDQCGWVNLSLTSIEPRSGFSQPVHPGSQTIDFMGRKFPNLTAAKNYFGASYPTDVNIHFVQAYKEIPGNGIHKPVTFTSDIWCLGRNSN
jgi:hypothetical protein